MNQQLHIGDLVKVRHDHHDNSIVGKLGILIDIVPIVRCGNVVMECYDVLVTDGCYKFVSNLLRSDIEFTQPESSMEKNR